ncbi:MAG: 30S ribosomal protein S6 [Deltaproteobacteria bacterium HGW-Deltaproteobacteria-10]|nr:MAG: 30S ribosomal protein S6 [Deltaproteobacteria bacterium HGW-Deltaproteobacteria-10]
MKRYEVIAIVKSDLAEDDLTAIIERSQTIITDRKGVIAKVDKWGKRRLAYEINKQKDGFYFLIDFAGDGPIVAEIERSFKIDDRILKFMTVKKEGAVTREGMEQETAVVETKRTQIRIEPNTSASTDDSAAHQGDRAAGEATSRRPAPRKIYNKEEQPTRGE